MAEADHEKPDRALSELAAGLRGRHEWMWDGRFGTALAEFPLEHKAEVLEGLARLMPGRWDSRSITEAPETIRGVVRHLGGLMPGQLLFTADSEGRDGLFCAWWPWGNGLTISIRIGVFGGGSDPEAMKAQADVLRGAFAVE